MGGGAGGRSLDFLPLDGVDMDIIGTDLAAGIHFPVFDFGRAWAET